MKHSSLFFKIISMGILCFFLWCGVGCNTNIRIPKVEDSEDENPIVSIWGIHLNEGKQHYKAGETFDTTGDKLSVRFADGTRSYISRGFTQEWAEGWGRGSYSEWCDDSSNWAPIRHGDPLPVAPYSSYMSGTFYVRADLMGMKGSPSFREVSYK